MEYSQAKFKQLAVEYVLENYKGTPLGSSTIVQEAKIIEAYLSDTK